jgi:uncharacterized membrane protein (DUF441 family)
MTIIGVAVMTAAILSIIVTGPLGYEHVSGAIFIGGMLLAWMNAPMAGAAWIANYLRVKRNRS